jgi:hypothetical protein
VPPPSPRNADKPHYREPKVPLSTNAGVLQTRHRRKSHNNTEDVIRSRKTIAFQVDVGLCSAEKRQRPASGTSSCTPANAVTARLGSQP